MHCCVKKVKLIDGTFLLEWLLYLTGVPEDTSRGYYAIVIREAHCKLTISSDKIMFRITDVSPLF